MEGDAPMSGLRKHNAALAWSQTSQSAHPWEHTVADTASILSFSQWLDTRAGNAVVVCGRLWGCAPMLRRCHSAAWLLSEMIVLVDTNHRPD